MRDVVGRQGGPDRAVGPPDGGGLTRRGALVPGTPARIDAPPPWKRTATVADMQVVAVRPDDSTVAVAQVLGHRGSEVSGPCFSPDGSRLYFSSQRAPVGGTGLPLGATYEVAGPFGDLLGRP